MAGESLVSSLVSGPDRVADVLDAADALHTAANHVVEILDTGQAHLAAGAERAGTAIESLQSRVIAVGRQLDPQLFSVADQLQSLAEDIREVRSTLSADLGQARDRLAELGTRAEAVIRDQIRSASETLEVFRRSGAAMAVATQGVHQASVAVDQVSAELRDGVVEAQATLGAQVDQLEQFAGTVGEQATSMLRATSDLAVGLSRHYHDALEAAHGAFANASQGLLSTVQHRVEAEVDAVIKEAGEALQGQLTDAIDSLGERSAELEAARGMLQPLFDELGDILGILGIKAANVQQAARDAGVA